MGGMLAIKNLSIHFGGIRALNGIDLAVRESEILSIIGPNGSGKTTLFNCLTGIYHPDEGDIVYQGESLIGLSPDAVAIRGIARTFQNIRLFQDLQVIENVLISYHGRLRSSFMGAVLGTPLYHREEKEMHDGAMALLQRVRLADFAYERAAALPYGQQRRLEIARALATHPKLLLLDEPAAGMNPQETQELMDFILKIKEDFDLTVLLIEHDMRVVMGICQRIKVLDYGATIAEGTPKEIQSNPQVITAYLGEAGGKGIA